MQAARTRAGYGPQSAPRGKESRLAAVHRLRFAVLQRGCCRAAPLRRFDELPESEGPQHELGQARIAAHIAKPQRW